MPGMRRRGIALAIVGCAFVAAFGAVLLAPTPVSAKGRELSVYPAEATWGETVFIEGFNWPGDRVDVYARFATTRAGLERRPFEHVAVTARDFDNGIFLEPVVVEVFGRDDAPPGWMEFMARVGEDDRQGPDDPYAELTALLLVTAKGRPADGGFIEGRIETLPGVSAGNLYAVWAPASNAAAYRFQHVGFGDRRGFYRTGYLEDEDWLVGIVDVDDAAAALNSDLESVRGQPPQLDHEVTWRFRKVTVRGGQPVGGVDFLIGDRALAEQQAEPAVSLPNAGGGRGPRSGAALPGSAAVVATSVAAVVLMGFRLMRKVRSGGER